jgi:hypothetical protein
MKMMDVSTCFGGRNKGVQYRFGKHPIEVAGTITIELFGELAAAFALVTPRLLRAVRLVNILPDAHFTDRESGHAHGRTFCVRTLFSRKTVWHEAGHCLTSDLNDHSFITEWRKVAGDIYGTKCKKDFFGTAWREGGDGPRHGCIEAYGATNEDEDIATMTAAVYGRFWEWTRRSRIDVRDRRYPAKLELLYIMDFIPEELYLLARKKYGW